jgi:CRP/FNR family cyclic AMP-dependent transcriptional regulator
MVGAPRDLGRGDDIVRVFDVDDELRDALPSEMRGLAVQHGVARVRQLSAGPWDPRAEPSPGVLGLLVLEGLILHDVRIGSAACTELIARCDVLRPWDEDGHEAPVPLEAEWRVLEPARLAILDRRFALVAGRFPEVMAALLGRTTARARGLVALMSISHLTRIEARVHVCLWYLADRFGRVTSEGVVLPLPLTHLTLARLVGAQRPSVTTALGELADHGRVARRPDGTYLLLGEPPAADRFSSSAFLEKTARNRAATVADRPR